MESVRNYGTFNGIIRSRTIRSWWRAGKERSPSRISDSCSASTTPREPLNNSAAAKQHPMKSRTCGWFSEELRIDQRFPRPALGRLLVDRSTQCRHYTCRLPHWVGLGCMVGVSAAVSFGGCSRSRGGIRNRYRPVAGTQGEWCLTPR